MLDLIENINLEKYNAQNVVPVSTIRKSSLPNFFSKSKQRIAIEFDTNLVKVILVDNANSPDSARYVKVKFLPDDCDINIKKALEDHIRETGIHSKIHTSIAVPRHLVHAKLARVPSHDPAELQDMIRYQVENELPLPLKDVVYDFRVVSREDDGYAHVMIVVARRAEIERYATIARSVGLIIDAVVLTFEAIYYSFLKFFGKLPEISTQCIALVDVDFSNANIIVIDRGELIFCRSVKGGVNHLIENMVSTNREKSYNNWLIGLTQGVSDTLQVFKQENVFARVEHIILSGWLPKVHFITEFMTRQLDMPVAWFDTAVPLEHLVETGVDGVKKNWFSVSALLGMVCENPGTFMDLRTENDKKISKMRNTVQKMSRLLGLIVYIVLLSIITFEIALHLRDGAIVELQDKIHALKPNLESFQRAKNLDSEINKRLGGSEYTATIISQLFEKLPAPVKLRSVTFLRGDKLIVRGTSVRLADIFNLPQIFEGQPAFTTVNITSADRRVLADASEIVEFELNIKLKKKGH
ncbi:MAG: hypothetical protein DWQ05_07710 [Calditrichaeota bacterium]|nr:MAG: hypothetical protein DWQ05_07710 [Calditrichota bacterium]